MGLVFFGSVAAAVCYVAFRRPVGSNDGFWTISATVPLVIVLVGGALPRALLPREACCALSNASAEGD